MKTEVGCFGGLDGFCFFWFGCYRVDFGGVLILLSGLVGGLKGVLVVYMVVLIEHLVGDGRPPQDFCLFCNFFGWFPNTPVFVDG